MTDAKSKRWSFKRAFSASKSCEMVPEEAPPSTAWGCNCPICFKTVKSMKILPCKHEFCPDCLEQLLTRHSQGDANGASFPCPICREALRVDEAERVPTKDYGCLRCGLCKAEKSAEDVWWCAECVEIICSRCAFKYHRSLDGHPEPEPWESLKALEQAHYYLRNCKGKEDAMLRSLEGKIQEMSNLRESLTGFFAQVVETAMQQVADEEVRDIGSESVESQLASLLEQHFRLKDPGTGFVPRGKTAEEVQQKLSAVAQAALATVGVKLAPPQSGQPKKTALEVRAFLSRCAPEDFAKQVFESSQSPPPRPPALPKRRVRSVASGDENCHSLPSSPHATLQKKRSLPQASSTEWILEEEFLSASLQLSVQEPDCLAFDARKAVYWLKENDSWGFKKVAEFFPTHINACFLAVALIGAGSICALEGGGEVANLLIKGKSRKLTLLQGSNANLLAASKEANEELTVALGTLGGNQISVIHLEDGDVTPPILLNLDFFGNKCSLSAIALSPSGALLSVLNGSDALQLYAENNRGFQLLRCLRFQHFGLSGVISAASHFHQFQFLRCKDHMLLVAKTQTGVAAFSVNYLRNSGYVLEPTPGTDDGLVGRRQQEVLRIQEFLGHPWGYQAVQRTTQVMAVAGLEVPLKYLGHWQANLLCPNAQKMKTAGVQLRPTSS